MHLDNGKKHIIKALVDSGCAKTAISLKSFKQLKLLDPTLQINKSSTRIQTCDGSTHSVQGTSPLTFSLDKQQKLPIQVEIMIIEHLADDMLLGSDILSSTIINKTTPTAIYLQHPLSNETYQENFLTKTFPASTLSVSTMQVLHPKEELIVTHKTPTHRPWERTFQILPIKSASLIPLSVHASHDRVHFTLMNDGDIPINVTALPTMARINELTTLEAPSTDPFMTPQERLDAVDQAKQLGYYQPSITSFITERNMITQADKVDIPPPRSDSEFLALFDTAHFHQDDKLALSNILLKHRSAFAMHKYDIGKTNVLEMDIEITVKQNRIQKYTSIAMNVRERAKEILEQMEKYDIIRECHEPSPYVSNILVIPQKRWSSSPSPV